MAENASLERGSCVSVSFICLWIWIPIVPTLVRITFVRVKLRIQDDTEFVDKQTGKIVWILSAAEEVSGESGR